MTRSNFMKNYNIDRIREFVRSELCEKNELEKDAFHMAERLLTRNGQPCGLYFCIYGPRSVRLTAVWDLASGSIFFYDSMGRRAACCPPPIG